MTALRKYARLEAPALWRQTEATQRRDVFVGFGDATLVISDKTGTVLSHWSLPAVRRLNPGEVPALFSPTHDAGETLEIEDDLMTGAIEEIRRAIERRRPRPGRLRLLIFLAMLAVVLMLGVFWLPGAVERHALRVVPPETRRELGARMLSEIMRLTGPVCASDAGTAALARLRERLSIGGPGDRFVVLPAGLALGAHLPGGLILLNRRLVEGYDAPDVAAAFALVEELRREAHDPLAELLSEAGTLAGLRLLATGTMDDSVIAAHAERILTRKAPLPPAAAVAARFRERRIATAPLAYALDITGETVLPLIEADPYRDRAAPLIISDADWIGLQGICGN